MDVRRGNLSGNLDTLQLATFRAYANIDANYWKKCVEHVLRTEIPYYIAQDATLGITNVGEIGSIEYINPMLIDDFVAEEALLASAAPEMSDET